MIEKLQTDTVLASFELRDKINELIEAVNKMNQAWKDCDCEVCRKLSTP